MHSYLHFCRNLQGNSVVMWFTGSILVSLFIWLAHYLSAFLTVGSMIIVNLRVLGAAGRSQSLTQVSKFFSPWMWTGIAMLIFTGLLMLAGDAVLFCTNSVFGVNLLITALAIICGVIVTKKIPAWDQPSGAPWQGKLLASISLLLWIGTILSAVEVPARSNVP